MNPYHTYLLAVTLLTLGVITGMFVIGILFCAAATGGW